ncbi:MAG: hypothetical protein RL756_1739 [Pseudomonadota bacterium]|jgi:hypothetical protein
MTPPVGTRVIWWRMPRRGSPCNTPRLRLLGYVRKRAGSHALVELDDGEVAWADAKFLEVVGNG